MFFFSNFFDLFVFHHLTLQADPGNQSETPRRPSTTTTEENKDADGDTEELETVSLRIPLTSTGSAGFGISVRCRNGPKKADEGEPFSGLYIKTVLPGGAAAKVCGARLEIFFFFHLV